MSPEKRCKGTTKNAHDQIFYKKNAIFYKKSAFLKEIRGHGLHFATVASGELLKFIVEVFAKTITLLTRRSPKILRCCKMRGR